MYGDGEQRRCFCHVADTVDGADRAARPSRTPWATSSTSARTNEISIRELAERVIERDRLVLARSCTIPYDEAYEEGFEDMERRVPDITQDPRR